MSTETARATVSLQQCPGNRARAKISAQKCPRRKIRGKVGGSVHAKVCARASAQGGHRNVSAESVSGKCMCKWPAGSVCGKRSTERCPTKSVCRECRTEASAGQCAPEVCVPNNGRESGFGECEKRLISSSRSGVSYVELQSSGKCGVAWKSSITGIFLWR